MITRDNLDKVEKHVKTGYILTTKTLKEFGFHIGEIAYLIETKRLIQGRDGNYEYLGIEQEKTNQNFEKTCASNQTPEVLLSLLLREKDRIEIDTKDPDWKFLEEKSNLLEKKKGIIILKAMSEERRHKIYRFVKAMPSILAFPIDKGSENKRVVLQYFVDNHVDIGKLMVAGDNAYHRKYFRESIRYYLKAFVHLRRPSPYLYGRLGLSYMKIGQTRKAIDFLIVADSMYKAKGEECKFMDLIEELKKKNGQLSERKFCVPFEEAEFKNDAYECYGLEAIEEMAAFVSSGKTIEEVQIKFDLTEEQVTLLMLVFARNCYTARNFTLGDQYLKRVEKRKNKTEQVKRLLDEIRRKKRFYQNQIAEGVKPFVLTR